MKYTMNKDNLRSLKAITTKKPNGELEAIASDETLDRSGDSIKIADWNFTEFLKNPVLQAGHDYKPQYTIGIAKNVRVEGKKVKFTPVFHEITQLAREIGEMYRKGFLKAWSVGFIPAQEKDEKHELLEVSAVAVPANPNALTLIKSAMESVEEDAVENIDTWIKKEVEKKPEETDEPKEDTEEVEQKSVIPYEDHGQEEADTKWDAKKEVKSADNTDLLVMSAWVDMDAPTEKESYKFVHHSASDVHKAVFNGVKEAMAEFLDDKDVPKEDRKEVYEHLKSHYKEFDEKAPAFKEIEEEEVEEKVEEKKEVKKFTRWNKSLPEVFDKEFDHEEKDFTIDKMKRFLGVDINKIFINTLSLPSPMLGTYLAALKSKSADFDLVDIRNYGWNGEIPPEYHVVKLNSKESDDFLIEGWQYYKVAGRKSVIIRIFPTWTGLVVSVITSINEKEWNKDFVAGIHKHAKENNYLKGEKFSLSGEFLPKSEDNWDNIYLEKDVKDSVKRAIKVLDEKGADSISRGLLLVGSPGTGKTKSGRTILNESKSTFIWVSARDFRKLDASAALQLSFKLARDLAPAVVFIEDVDTWLKGYTVDLLKTELDGILQNKGVVTMLTSNFPEKIPEALIDRPGRFHDILEFALPDEKMRVVLLNGFLGEKVDEKTIAEFAKATEGYSAAHIKELVTYAEMIADDEEVELSKALGMSLEKINKQKKLIGDLKLEEKEEKVDVKGLIDLVQKEGRVISKKNKITITATIDTLQKTVVALEKLLELSEIAPTAPENAGDGDKKGREPELAQEDLLVRTLQKIAGKTAFALSKHRESVKK